MLGAEAISVLGVVSSIVAIVDGTKKVFDAASDVEGLPEAFREVSGRLPLVKETLGSTEQHVRRGNVDAASCETINPLLKRCEERATTLDSIFQKVIPPDGASRLERYFMATKSLGKGSRVESLMKGLLDGMLLMTSRWGLETATGQHAAHLVKAIEELSTVPPSIPDSQFQEITFTNNNFGSGSITNNNVMGDQKFLANFGTGKAFQAEKQTFNMENETVNKQIFHAHVQNFASPARQEYVDWTGWCEDAMLSQLRFDGIDERFDDIAEAHARTFQWIYERSELGFVDWLEAGRGIYWITGKAGSGKSTLMKFIYKDERTRNCLPTDYENILVSSFFFHDRGSDPLLRSQEGLYRAIIHSILSQYRQLIPIALPKRWEEIRRMKETPLAERTYAKRIDWKVQELKQALRAIASQETLRLHLCLLIDGLDEFWGHHQDMVDALTELLPALDSSHMRVQLCLSSRPLVVFEKAYDQHVHLKVQDLTQEDIKTYVTTHFSRIPELKNLQRNDPTTTSQIIEEILQKAEGVFLWVMLVVRSLAESLENGDDMKTLQRRLSVLPPGLEPLYQRMLNQIDSFYHAQAAQIFRIVDAAVQPLSPLALSFADDNPRNALFPQNKLSSRQILERFSQISKRLKARTAGLIEINPIRRRDSGGMFNFVKSGKLHLEPSRVQYLHLTVKEFLLSDTVPRWLGTQALQITASTHVDIIGCCLRQYLATRSLSAYGYTRKRNIYKAYYEAVTNGLVFMITSHARQAEKTSGGSQWVYLEALNDWILAEQTRVFPMYDQHWTTYSQVDYETGEGDYAAYLVSIGMTQSVIESFDRGYQPSKKPGRPLLLYAICTRGLGRGADDHRNNLIMVKELLGRGCDPNQAFERRWFNKKFYSTVTVWEDVLWELYQVFEVFKNYRRNIDNDEQDITGWRTRWLNIIKIFLEYGADPHQLAHRHTSIHGIQRLSALSLFNRVFSSFDDPLVRTIRDLMISKGATEIEEVIPLVQTHEERKSKLHRIPLIGPFLAEKRRKRGKQG